MLIATKFIFWLLFTIISFHALLVLRFLWALRTYKLNPLSDDGAPLATVILCLRGADPFLPKCISGLLQQDYPNYNIHIVIDHPTDPAHHMVREFMQEEAKNNLDKISIEFLENPDPRRSLKCSSLIQAVDSLDHSCEIVVLADSDTIPHRGWLRELASALQNEKVGVATGNRWYMPDNHSVGTLMRYFWNAGAVVQMFNYRIPWGGSLAIKTQLLRETGTLGKWRYALSDDAILYSTLKTVDMRVEFVAPVMMVNREDCNIFGYFEWVRRQLLMARLYHPAWFMVFAHGVSVTIGPTTALALLLLSLIAGNSTSALWSFAAITFYQFSLIFMLLPVEGAVRRIVRARKERTEWLPQEALWKYMLAFAGTQLTYLPILLSSSFLSIVTWRGIKYRICGPWQIRMLEYRPFQTTRRSNDQTSL